jgi:hypothetical protein
MSAAVIVILAPLANAVARCLSSSAIASFLESVFIVSISSRYSRPSVSAGNGSQIRSRFLSSNVRRRGCSSSGGNSCRALLFFSSSSRAPDITRNGLGQAACILMNDLPSSSSFSIGGGMPHRRPKKKSYARREYRRPRWASNSVPVWEDSFIWALAIFCMACTSL